MFTLVFLLCLLNKRSLFCFQFSSSTLSFFLPLSPLRYVFFRPAETVWADFSSHSQSTVASSSNKFISIHIRQHASYTHMLTLPMVEKSTLFQTLRKTMIAGGTLRILYTTVLQCKRCMGFNITCSALATRLDLLVILTHKASGLILQLSIDVQKVQKHIQSLVCRPSSAKLFNIVTNKAPLPVVASQ